LQRARLFKHKTKFRSRIDFAPTKLVVAFLGPREQGCQIFLSAADQKRGKMYPIAIKYTQWPQNITNGRKIDQTAKKYANIFHCKALRNLPKLGFFVLKIWQPC
jgi:hypothetical protein